MFLVGRAERAYLYTKIANPGVFGYLELVCLERAMWLFCSMLIVPVARACAHTFAMCKRTKVSSDRGTVHDLQSSSNIAPGYSLHHGPTRPLGTWGG